MPERKNLFRWRHNSDLESRCLYPFN